MNQQQENFCSDCGEEKPLDKLFDVVQLKAAYKKAAIGRAIRVVDRLQIPIKVKASAAKGESQPLSFQVPDDDKHVASSIKDYLSSQGCPSRIVSSGLAGVKIIIIIEIEPFWAQE